MNSFGWAWFLMLFVSFSAWSIDAGEPSQTIQVELPIVDDRYDAQPLSRIGVRKEVSVQENVWFPMTIRTRLALALLKAEGTIAEYEVKPDRIIINFNREKIDEIQGALFPPHFLNIDDLADQPKIAVLVHGLEGGAMTYRNLAPALSQHGWFPLQLIYPNDGGVDKPSEFLRNELKRLHAKHPRTRFAVIAHSLGGLVSWDALARSDSDTTGVTDLVTLGTPFGGSNLAQFQSELELSDVAIRIMAGDWAGLDIGRDGSGEAIEVLQPESALRREILARPLPTSVRLHMIAGSAGPIKANERKEFAELMERLIVKFQTKPEYAENLRKLANAPELIDGAGDGAVTIENATSVKRFQSVKVFPLSHVGLLLKDTSGDSDTSESRQALTWILSQLEGN